MKDAPQLSIIIPNWNGENLLRDCLNSILEKTTGISFEIIVVDDASTDRSVELISQFPSAKLVRNPNNVGFVKTCNMGAAVSEGKYMILLNNDTTLRNNAFKVFVDFLDHNPDVGICGGTLMNPEGVLQHPYGNFPSLIEALEGAVLLGDLFPQSTWVKRRAIIPSGPTRKMQYVDYVVGANLVLRREVYEAFGLFDEAITAYCEETELCYRVRQSGRWKVAYVPEAEIIHLYTTSYSIPRERIRLQMKSYDYFFRKHHGGFYSLLVRLLYAWQYTLKFLIRAFSFLATGAHKKDRILAMKEALYLIRFSLKPS